MKKVTLYQYWLAVGTVGDDTTDDVFIAYEAAGETERAQMREDYPDLFAQAVHDLDPDTRTCPENFL